MTPGFSLKDQLFNDAKVRGLADRFASADPGFDGPGFHARVMARLLELELKQRIAWIAECLGQHLPGDLPALAPVLRAALPPPLDPGLGDNDFGDFIHAPLGELVVARGLESDPDLVLDLLGDITRRFSMEWAIRPVLNRWPDLVLERMQDWAGDPNYHVRRLVSEGTRPRLPWGAGITLAPDRPLPLLDRLQGDATRYVTRSVANHLNDITRKAPDLAIDRLEQWRGAGGQSTAELDWMTAHALRGLVRAGHPRALALLGFDSDAAIDLVRFEATAQVAIGDRLEVCVRLNAARGAPAIVDFLLWRRRADGGLARKVFKGPRVDLPAGDVVELKKVMRLKGDATTFRLFPGTQRIEVQVNGRVLGGADFELVEAL